MSIFDAENYFFDRKAVLALLNKRIFGLKEGYRQNVALLGNRYIGKTAILYKFLNDLEDNDIITIYLDLENKDFVYVLSQFIRSLLYNFLKSKKIPLHDDIEVLKESARPFLPKTIEEIARIQHHWRQGKFAEAYRGLVSLPEKFTFEADKFCVLVFDEFHHLDGLSITDAYQELGKKIMTQKRCLYVVTSSYPNLATKILSEKLSLLFGNFEVVKIGPFDLKTSQDFIEDRLKQIKMGVPLRNFLIDFTGGHPLYLNLILQEVIHLSSIHKQEEVFVPLLVQAIENTLFNQWGILGRHFDMTVEKVCTDLGQGLVTSLLIAIAQGNHKLRDLVTTTGVTPSLVKQKLNRLIDAEIVGKNGSLYCVQDKLLKYWLKYVFEKRLKELDHTIEKLRNEFRQEIERSFEHLKTVAQKDLSTIIMELLNCFDNEAFSHNGRRYKLPLFRNIEPFKMRDEDTGRDFDVIKASSPEGAWFIMIKKDPLCENDVNVFLKELKKFRKRPQHCVIISLSDLDENARIKALQERVWIWNEGEMKTLLDLFDKPYIVR